MKNQRLNLIATLALSGWVIFGGAARAADAQKQDKPNSTAERRAPRRPQGPEEQLKRMTAQLKLTEEQQHKIKPLLREQTDKLKALRKDTTLSAQDRRAKAREIHEAAAAKIKPVLTADQAEKWAKMRQRRHGRRQQ